MQPGSIYAGFGSKEAMFLQVLDCYVEQSLI
jgi:TetR/AcrR family transcriptional repressor of nem operon